MQLARADTRDDEVAADAVFLERSRIAEGGPFEVLCAGQVLGFAAQPTPGDVVAGLSPNRGRLVFRSSAFRHFPFLLGEV